jgi:hypothetical protein
MAVQTASHETLGPIHIITWPSLANGDTGDSAVVAANPDKTLQIVGTFGVGGTVVLQGSNDGTNWVTLNDGTGSAISLTAAGLVSVLENPRYVRPNVTAGDGTTDITVTICAKA